MKNKTFLDYVIWNAPIFWSFPHYKIRKNPLFIFYGLPHGRKSKSPSIIYWWNLDYDATCNFCYNGPCAVMTQPNIPYSFLYLMNLDVRWQWRWLVDIVTYGQKIDGMKQAKFHLFFSLSQMDKLVGWSVNNINQKLN